VRSVLKLVASLVILIGLLVLPPGVDQGEAQAPRPSQPAAEAPTTAPQDGAAGPGNAAAPTLPSALPREAMEPVERLARSIEDAEKSIQQLKELEGELARLRSEVERIIYDSTSTAETLRPQLEEVDKQIQRLGPPPGKDQPPESPTVMAERARLNSLKASLDGAIKTTELAWLRAKQLIDRITVIRYQLFTQHLLERRDSPLLPEVWRNLASEFPTIRGRLTYYGGDWLTWAARVSGWLVALGASIAVVYVLLSVVIRRYIAHRLVRPELSPSFVKRTIKAAWVAPARMVAPAVAILMLYFGLAALDLLFAPWIGLASATLSGVLVYIAARALLAVAFAPRHPAWRLVPVADGTARQILVLIEAFVAVYVIDTVLVEIGRAIYVPLKLTVVQSFFTSVTFVILLALLVLTPFVPQTGPDRPVNGHEYVPRPVTLLSPLWIKLPLIATALVILVSSLLGYIALGRFIAHQVVLSGTVLAGCGLLYLAVRSATRGRADSSDLVSVTLEKRFGLLDPVRRRQFSWLVEVMATLLIATAAYPLLMLQWGFSGDDIRDWLKALLFGFEIGQFRISLARILIGIGLFTVLLFGTRLAQRWLRERVLTQPRVDAGIANSVDTAIGYAGIGLALLVALSYAGLDITSLAIVAGALSVGIGFGLQSIVNNFVSGLILLVERPVKVGDWIVVGSEQGNVRRISVRSTEIETFDKASLIIPNSELITGRVLNWTHRNPLGRAVVKVETVPSADPEEVLAILRECALATPDTLKTQAPFITFDNFSNTKLEFTVRAVVPDVYSTGKVGTELRVAILKRLREKGLQLDTGHPQYDVHLRDLDWIKATAVEVAKQRGRMDGPQPDVSAAAPPAGSNDNA
jgi:small-conductance mechanosensitive channel